MVLQLAELDNPPHRTGASPAAIISHYDMGEEFFQLVLDPDLVYSCALFEAGDSLWDAQRRKLDHHIQASGAATAKRVLDIGCGWGALLRRLCPAQICARARSGRERSACKNRNQPQ